MNSTHDILYGYLPFYLKYHYKQLCGAKTVHQGMERSAAEPLRSSAGAVSKQERLLTLFISDTSENRNSIIEYHLSRNLSGTAKGFLTPLTLYTT